MLAVADGLRVPDDEAVIECVGVAVCVELAVAVLVPLGVVV